MPTARIPGRLPAGVRPTRYDVSLRVDPRRERFEGTVSIALAVEVPTRTIFLHALDIAAKRVVLKGAGGRSIPGTLARATAQGSEPDEGEVEISLSQEASAGAATLEIAYDAPFNGQMAGLYRVKDRDDWYAFTQFEAADARRCFPCFDEPSFKVPLRATVAVPDGMLAFSNGPEESRQTRDGWTTFTFLETPPLPTYLVAFVAGALDVVQYRGRCATPLRALAARGKGEQTELALRFSAELLGVLEEYFGRPYPYAKLDIAALPEFSSGAMENAGLITFREELLLGYERTATRSRLRSMANVIAHEISHQWFGNLVTMRWWDDLWLNESFATFMATIAMVGATRWTSYWTRFGT
ncbi:MAG: M1 family peptidase, partial [Planctomycetes bacterium]|nr:M1 family peptidase [Planctomycetota bacterium]